tara:strand:+ start:167 stop:592 length:426 start_codon:yes stop_codon:yes gene_type:complete
MPIELISLITGNVSGFVFKLIASQAEATQRLAEANMKSQQAADDSADRAAVRGGEGGAWVRRFIVIMVLTGVIIFPFLMGLIGGSVTIEGDAPTGLLATLGLVGKEMITVSNSYLMTSEIRSSVLAIVGFYFGSSVLSSKK